MAPRRRQPRRSRNVGTTRMDAALDSMRLLGFDEKLVRETVNELLDVYDGTQGWPFVEEGSYKLLIETLLSKASNEQEKQFPSFFPAVKIVWSALATERNSHFDGLGIDHTNDEAIEMAATPTGITDVGSSSLVAQESLFITNDGVDSAFQTGDEDPASLDNEENNNQAIFPLGGVSSLSNEIDVVDLTVPAGGGGREQDIGEEARENEPKHAANGSGSSREPFVSNVKSTLVEPFQIKSSKPLFDRSRLHYAWSGSDDGRAGKNEPKHAANITGSRSEPFVSNVKRTLVEPLKVKSSESFHRRRLHYARSGRDDYKAEKNEPKPADNVNAIGNNVKSAIDKPRTIESSRSRYRYGKPSYYEGTAYARNERNTSGRAPLAESSRRLKSVTGSSIPFKKNPHYRNRNPCYGWMDKDDREMELTKFPLPPLPEHVERLLGKSEAPQSSRRRRKSRWDEKPEDGNHLNASTGGQHESTAAVDTAMVDPRAPPLKPPTTQPANHNGPMESESVQQPDLESSNTREYVKDSVLITNGVELIDKSEVSHFGPWMMVQRQPRRVEP
ncbi:hypothetical protein RIF29_17524 [Crotalaria pallida]|uniref:WIYLD domain-containing protein n=1 Tax=Crotalaria pallida TaxID=3830 RepID=A0AAN9IGI4_CROPI